MAAWLWPLLVCADGAAPPPAAVVRELLVRDLAGVGGKELRMLTVEYVPGGASIPHRHNAQVFVYVLEGAVKMQVQGSEPVTLGPGETFYEGPDDIHTVSANASQSRPARILVFIVKDKAAPISTPVGSKAQP
jgi:quercetin dioxygenase-like cupin family protein